MAGKKVLVVALLVLAGSGFGAWLSLDGRGAQSPVVRITNQGANASVIQVTIAVEYDFLDTLFFRSGGYFLTQQSAHRDFALYLGFFAG